ncbi:FtsX-like permease family protein [Pseudoflavitalea sp. G-6-1-2]|uniref:ABC transporter permease n=1 Tax=Pseudoflavitalea sp. G-6-1-2 TaxID=2728841 RepID=UPI00146B76EC|nr:ABC transporter permease [Pseudoflavitalea sp. G-6-1-2]NML21257.1 FtsX-like permease family protein [Pseudoflavitalea sp. G-6-1-2]
MFRNFLKTAWRNIIRNKAYSTINVMGLAAGMAVALLIGLWVYEQYSYDKFFKDNDRIYRIQRNFYANGDTLTFKTVSLKLTDVLKAEIPEIEYIAESDWMGSHGLMVGDKKLYKRGGHTGSDFLKIFSYPLLQGNANSVLNDPFSIVLTESLAKALFGNEDPINKVVRFDNQNDLKVTGILKDLPANSTLQFSYLVPYDYINRTVPNAAERRQSFGNNNSQAFVKLKPGVTLEQVAGKIRNIEHTQTNNTNAMNSYVLFQPISRWHLYSNYVNGKDTAGFLTYVQIMSLIGVLILLIACINFVNLTTARSEKRAREVGVRKAIGSERKQLIIQFMAESLVLTIIGFAFAFVIVQMSLPAFNTMIEGKLSLPLSNPIFWLIMAGLIIFTTLIAGSRPAFYLSSFQPVKVLKGSISTGKRHSIFRRAMVVTQFSCSIALIIATIVIYRQIQHAKDRPSGYETSRLVEADKNDDLVKNYVAMRDELLQKRIVSDITTASSPATNLWWHSDVDQWPGKRAGETIEMGTVLVNAGYFKTMGMRIVDGRNFTGDYDTTSVVFNQTAIAQMRLKDPIGQMIEWQENKLHIAGVVNDALMISPFAAPEPMMFICVPEMHDNVICRIAPEKNMQEAIEQLGAVFNKYSPAYPFDYTFADANYADKFNLELLIGKLSALFAGLAIFISCLGLFGLAAYIAEQRTKEIGIRKVLGASVAQLWLLLCKDFIMLVMISCVIASPIALYFLQNWLDKYTYRVNIGYGVFFLAAGLALAIAVIVISFQAVKAALLNPVKSLKSE